MAEDKEADSKGRSFDEHPLYRSAMRQLAAGDESGAADRLRRLAQLYPQEQTVQDQLVRLELKATLTEQEEPFRERSSPAPALRTVVLVLIAVTVCIIVVAVGVIAYDRFVGSIAQPQNQESTRDTLLREGQQRLQAGDLAGAREVYEKVLVQFPGEPTAQAAITEIVEQEQVSQRYIDALDTQQRGDWQTALTLLRQLDSEYPGYRDVPQRIESLLKIESLEASWLEAQILIEAGNLTDATSRLTQIRAQNPEFRRTEVEEQLYQIYFYFANQQIVQANGNLDLLRQAISYLEQALSLRPTDQTLLEQRRLATEFVAGYQALAQGDRVGAVVHWESVQTTSRDYQGGILVAELQRVYPEAARQLIAEANGAVTPLRRANTYLDHAIAANPSDQALIDERQMVIEYVAGADAATRNDWDGAISRWGPISVQNPSYQNGELDNQLRDACAKSSNPDPVYCPAK